ncbi:amidase [Planktotalea sp.]|uniref:amidase n=1 Tax=Planktotalea sp. TaxID=2029877 RepID=UPI003F6C179E
MSEIVPWSAIETAQHIRARNVSVSEVTQAHLSRLDLANPELNAVTHLIDEALDLATAMDAKRIPDDASALYGVPVTVKVNVDMEGYPNTNGIPAFKDMTGDGDAPVVANLKSSGAVIIARTNTPEFSLRWSTSNPLHGVSLNPWDTAVTPGGSSGAAAACVASGIGAIAHGNDLGGSLRYPAYCCGVATIRPSMGRIAAMNPNAAADRPPITFSMSVQGPIARSVADVRAGLEVMSKRDPRDPLQVNAHTSGRPRDSQITLGIATNPFASDVDDAVVNAMTQARDAAKTAGIKTVEFTPPCADECAALWGDLLFTETHHTSRSLIEEHGSAEINRTLVGYAEHYKLLDMPQLFASLTRRLQLQRMWSLMFEEIDALLMPTSLIPPFENDLDFKEPSKIPDLLRAQSPLFVVNLLGLPSVAIPTHVENGLPLGVQLVAPMHDDWFALDIAERLETELGTLWQNLPVWA